MSTLLICLVIAVVLLCALVAFVGRDPAGADRGLQTGAAFAESDLGGLSELIFSERDRQFVREERSAPLEALFVRERRVIAAHFFERTLLRLRWIRAEHLQSSRSASDLNVLAEGKLLVLLFYLCCLCVFLLLCVRMSPWGAPRRLALHLESGTRRVVPAIRFSRA
jgi:hypothetical protein